MAQKEKVADAFYRLGVLHKRTGHLNQACDALNRADSIYKDAGATANFEASLVLQEHGEVLNGLGKTAEALADARTEGLRLAEAAKKGHERDRVTGELLHLNGEVLSDVPSRRAEALTAYQKALKIRLELAARRNGAKPQRDLARPTGTWAMFSWT